MSFVPAFTTKRIRFLTIGVFLILLMMGILGMEAEDALITILRGLSTGMIIFLVAAGLSLIFGLMDVLNLAHGELFMLGAYTGWTVFVRPDTFIDILAPIAFLTVGFLLLPVWRYSWNRASLSAQWQRLLPWGALLVGLGILIAILSNYPIAVWNPDVFAESPNTYSLALSQNNLVVPDAPPFDALSPLFAIVGLLLSGVLLGLSIVGFQLRNRIGVLQTQINARSFLWAGIVLIIGLIAFFANDSLTTFLLTMDTTVRFFVAIAIAVGLGFVMGMFVETSLIRPLYNRPIYQLMITLGLSFILIEVVRVIWGRPEFTMPRPSLFTGGGEGCPAASLNDFLTYHCSTISLFGSRIRSYNEIFIILVGLIVLIAVWLLLQRTRIGMIIRAGVQDSEMVEALGINVRRIFTIVFGLGVGLATLGGILAAPSTGLSVDMGTRLLLSALIALAIGGLTSFPGAAAGAILVGLIQQFIIKYGQIGIQLPFLEEPFRPSPPLVPASVVLIMVIILLVLPNGLFGRNE